MEAVVFNTEYYSDEVIRNPIPHFAEMRRLGPVFWLPSQNAYAVARHAEVVEVL